MPLVFGLLAALGAFAVVRGASASERLLTLLRATVPFTGVATMGSVVALLADRGKDAGGVPLAPLAFKVRIVGLPPVPGANITAVFLTDTLGAKAGQFLEFTPDKIQNVDPS